MQSLSQWAKAGGHDLLSPQADLRLAAAYRAVFSANATREDAEIVLVDLALASRFYEHMAPDAPESGLRFVEGRRSLMRRVIGFIADARVLGDLQIAALQEAIVTESTTIKRTRK